MTEKSPDFNLPQTQEEIEALAQKVFDRDRGSGRGRLSAHIKAVRLLDQISSP
jgi:hypothetical protein